MAQVIYQVDAFTDRPFSGNPAGVCLMEEAADERWMQHVASEMNLSETAFLYPVQDGFNLRWFTPSAEVDLCGHATLATAHTLWETGVLQSDETALFHTKSGDLICTLQDGWIEMDFPSMPASDIPAPAALADAIGAAPLYVGKGGADIIVELESEQVVRELSPDMGALKQIDVRGVMVTARGDSEDVDFVSRFFAPCVGIDEDPVTGSAHCCLTPYWAAKLNKKTMTAHQVSARHGTLLVELQGDRVKLMGQAVTVMRIELLVS